MKTKLIKYYSKINLVFMLTSLILVILSDFFSFDEKTDNIIVLLMVFFFLFSVVLDLIASEVSVSLIILYLNKYSKIFSPLLLLTTLAIIFIYVFSNFVTDGFVSIYSNIVFVYSFALPIIRVFFDGEYVQKMTNGRIRRRR